MARGKKRAAESAPAESSQPTKTKNGDALKVWPELDCPPPLNPEAPRCCGETRCSATCEGAGSRQTSQDFMTVYEQLKKEILEDPILGTCPKEARAWMEEMLDYTVVGGKVGSRTAQERPTNQNAIGDAS